MASQAKLTVDFRPTKRIKKRRELDALVSTKHRILGRSGTVSPTTGRKELLRNESESSEMEEFDVPAKIITSKRSRCCPCSSCFGLICGVLLAICLVSICGLIMMYVQLRRDVTELQAKLAKVDDLTSSYSSQLHDLSSMQQELSHRVQRFSNGFSDIRKNISTIVSQVNALDGLLKSFGRDVNRLRAANSLASNNPSINIAAKTKHLARNRLSEEEEADDEALLEQLSPKFSWIEKKLNLLNVTFHRRLEEMKEHSALVDVSVSALSNYTLLLNKRIRFLELRSADVRRPSSDEQEHLDRILQNQIKALNANVDSISNRLDAVSSSVEKLHNSTNANVRTLNTTTHNLLARLKLLEVTLHLMLSDSIASEATPGGKEVDPAPPHPQSSAMKARPGSSSSSTTESNFKNRMQVGRSTTVLGNLPKS